MYVCMYVCMYACMLYVSMFVFLYAYIYKCPECLNEMLHGTYRSDTRTIRRVNILGDSELVFQLRFRRFSVLFRTDSELAELFSANSLLS